MSEKAGSKGLGECLASIQPVTIQSCPKALSKETGNPEVRPEKSLNRG